ncbi:hypothetical protein JOC75_000930 [Metabacillus crassostreae]|uniref:DUF3986 family protein n=1 Tax=Metabacillus crassostreae TaxID=929098 RepID=UPI001956B767|nr:DUF3986 family protein [Metabacillus crassostreae]MBM7602960.1 hypothetical protein [Metabacillus crassostreae]
MSVKYDPRYHLHIGYYEDHHDFESIAYKVLDQDVWDIFFDFTYYNLHNHCINQEKNIDNLGMKIFSVQCIDLDYDEAIKLFQKWLRHEGII